MLPVKRANLRRFPMALAKSIALATLASSFSPAGCGRQKADDPSSPRVETGPRDYLHWPDAVSRPRAPEAGGRRLILLGWDGADWALLDSLMGQGRMPNLARLTSAGRSANLLSYAPTVSPMVWTTIATGASPEDHGVLDFFEIDPPSGRHVPISVESRQVPAYWSVASQLGQTVGVVNFWATFPAEEVKGFLLSDRTCPALVDPDAAQIPSAVYPPAYAGGIRSLLEKNPIPDAAVLRQFAKFRDQELGELPAQMLARLLRSTRVTEEAAETLDDRERPRSLALYVLGTDEVAHLFGKFAPPRLPCVSEDSFRRFSDVVARYYAWMDELLGRWMRRAQEDRATLLLVSDHGFKWGTERPCRGNPLEQQSATFNHAPVGIAAVWGKDVVPDRIRAEASVFDVAPTISALLELPVDAREPGRARVEWFEGVAPPARRELWANAAVRRTLPRILPSRTNEYVERLRSLGYLTGADSPVAAASESSKPGRTEQGWLNLGTHQNARGEREAALSSFRSAMKVAPGYAPALVDLVRTLLALHRHAEAVAAAESVLEFPGERQGWAIYEIAARMEAAGLITEEEHLLTEAVRRFPSSEPAVVSLGGLTLNQGRCEEAFRRVEPFLGRSRLPDTFNVAGFALRCLDRREESRRLLARSLALDPDQKAIRQALGLR